MTYQETLDYLFTQLPVFQNSGGSAYKPGLERVRELLALSGNPHEGLKAIHVAGTNGKGSTSSLLASILQAQGLRVGLFTSPHLVDFRERIRVNGQMVSEEYVVGFVKDLRPRIPETLQPSFFELTTAMAFAYFKKLEVDIAVIEVGMGGRLDSTNVLAPLVSVITNVSIDHAAYLGSTLAEIAHEKAGVIKPNTPIVLGRSREPEVLQVVGERSVELQAPLTLADMSREVMMFVELPTGGYKYTTQHYGTLSSPLGGVYQVENMRTVLATLYALKQRGIEVTEEAVRKGVARVASVGLRGRLEVIQEESPRVVLDTGHNADAWSFLAVQLEEWYENGGLVVLLGMAADKDVDTVLKQLPKGVHLFITKAKGQRSMYAEELAQHAQIAGFGDIRVVPVVAKAYEEAKQHAMDTGAKTLFVGGSNFVIGELLASL